LNLFYKLISIAINYDLLSLIAFINGNYFITKHPLQIINCILGLISIFIVKGFIIVNIKLYEIVGLAFLVHLFQAQFLFLVTYAIEQFALSYALKSCHPEKWIEADHVFHYVYELSAFGGQVGL
jgi:hypothetical protein